MNKQRQLQYTQYASIIHSAIVNLFEEEFIDVNDFDDSEKFKAFLYALSVAVPTVLHNKIVTP